MGRFARFRKYLKRKREKKWKKKRYKIIDGEIKGFESIFHVIQEPVWYISLISCSLIYSLLQMLILGEIYDVRYALNLWYSLDIIGLLCCKHLSDCYVPYLNPSHRPVPIILLDIISVLPIASMASYYFDIRDELTIYNLQNLEALKLVRVLYFLKFKSRTIHVSFAWRTIKLLIILMIIIFVGMCYIFLISNIFYSTYAQATLNGAIGFTGIVTTWGFPATYHLKDKIILINCISLYTMITMFIVNGFLMASNAYEKMLANKQKFAYRNKIRIILNQIKGKVRDVVHESAHIFYNVFWEQQRGFSYTLQMFDTIPYGLRTEILLDMFCPALKHSILFRDCDIGMARYLTGNMTQQFLAPGDVIFAKGSVKNKMIYIVSGIVEVISLEDNETAIISFTSGTCLGEISLFVSQINTLTVRCKNYVNIQILHRNALMKFALLYNDRYRKLLKKSFERYDEARRTYKLVNALKKQETIHKYYTLMWLKDITRKILSDDKEEYVKNVPELYIRYESNLENINPLLCTTKYLDLLSITDELQLTGDVELIKTTFPFILHPNSILVLIWEFIIILVCVYNLLIWPYYLFDDINVMPKLVIFSYVFISYLWIGDLLMQLCTAVITKYSFHKTFKSIFTYRINSIGFIIDVLSTIPMEIFSTITIKRTMGLNQTLLMGNRLLKVWRIFKMFKRWENSLHVSAIKLILVRFTFVLFYLIYSTNCLLYASICKYPPYDCNYTGDYYSIYSTVQLITGVGMLGPYDKTYHLYNVVYIIAVIFCSVMFIIVCVQFVASYILTQAINLTLENMVVELSSIFKIYQIPKVYTQRIYKFINIHYRFFNGMRLLSDNPYEDLSNDLLRKLKYDMNGHFVKQSKFFRDLPDDLFFDICSASQFMIIPSNEVVCYAGDYSQKLFIISRGYCTIAFGNRLTTLCDGDVVNIFAFLYQIPITRTCFTKTSVQFLVLKHDDFVRILGKYPNSKLFFGDQYRAYYTSKIHEYLRMDTELHKVVLWIEWNYYNFGYKFKRDSKKEYDYHVPFDELGQFRLIKYLLLRTTFNPIGNLYIRYETYRVIFIIISCVLHSTMFITESKKFYWKYPIYLVDATQLIDIYIRFHVAYFNHYDIIVKHPLYTARNYLKYNFLVDVISWLPLEFLKDHFEKPSAILVCLHGNRLFQLYRYWGLTNYLLKKIFKPKTFLNSLRTFPLFVITSLFIGSLILANECVIDEDVVQTDVMKEYFTDGIKCSKDMWLTTSFFSKPITPLRAQLYSSYIITSCMTTIGLQGSIMHDNYSGLIVSAFSIIGIYSTIILLYKIVSCSLSSSDILTMYQASLRNLQSYMRKNKVSTKLQQLIIEHNDTRWNRQRGKNVINLMQNFHYALRQDILFYIYGNQIYENCVFPIEGMKFIRNLLMHSSHETYVKGAKIIRVNDINNQIHIIFRGTVNVLAVDGTKIDAIYVGAIFGNIDGLVYVRQQMNFVAEDIVEILSVNSDQFFKVLNDHPKLLHIYTVGIERFLHYFPSKQRGKRRPKQDTFTYDDDEEGLMTKLKQLYSNTVFHPYSNTMRTWQMINFFSCLISVVMNMYQMALSEFNFYYLTLQYIFDFLYIVNFYVRYHLGYEDETGKMVTDLKEIKRNLKKHNVNYVLYIVGILPLDLMLLAIPKTTYLKINMFKVFRLNRLQRLQSMNEFIQFKRQRITVNVKFLQYGVITLKIILITIFSLCLILWQSTLDDINLSVHVPTDTLNLSGYDKFYITVRTLYMIVCMLSRIAQDIYYPQNTILILFCIVLMLCFLFIWSFLIADACSITFKNQYLRTLFRGKIDHLLYFVDKRDISADIRARLKRYINLLWLKYEGFFPPYLLNNSPLYIKEAILSYLYLKYINKHKIFKKCHVDFKRQMVCKFVPEKYYPGDYITFKDSPDNCVYVIRKGVVQVLDEDEKGAETQIKILYYGQWFGSMNFVKELCVQKYNYRSVNYCTILSLKYDDWKYLLDFFPATKAIILQGLNDVKDDFD